MVLCDACGGRLGPVSSLLALNPDKTEFLLMRRGDFSSPLSPRQASDCSFQVQKEEDRAPDAFPSAIRRAKDQRKVIASFRPIC